MSQYSSAAPFAKPVDSNLAASPQDAERIQAYRLYEDMYYNSPDTFKVTMRGEDEGEPLYVPGAKKIVEATARFLGVDFDFAVTTEKGTPAEQTELSNWLDDLFEREEMYAKFSTQRRYGLLRGDALWHVTADPSKAEGTRLSLNELDPSSYFVIEDEDGKRIGCHIVDTVQDPRSPDDKTKRVARRLTYRRMAADDGSPSGVTSETTLWALGKWDDRVLGGDELEKVGTVVPEFVLPDPIVQLPVYHVRNGRIPGKAFGVSEIAGVEALINGMNQSLTDEDLTLVMQGLGMYWTDARPPQNPDGSDAPWEIGPRTVVEVGQDNTFGRVTGVGSVAPFQEHIDSISRHIQEGQGIPDIAMGRVDVAVAESGVSLRLQLSPMLSSNAEKEREIANVYNHMLFDLATMWAPAYEGLGFGRAEARVTFGDPIPVDRKSVVQEVLQLRAAGLITIAQAQEKLTGVGYEFRAGDDRRVIEEAAQVAQAQMGDAFGDRLVRDSSMGQNNG